MLNDIQQTAYESGLLQQRTISYSRTVTNMEALICLKGKFVLSTSLYYICSS